MATYVKRDKATGKLKVHKIWNGTVANLSLMALGSSAPEIFLNVIGLFTDRFLIGELGPSTIVGSAAFNLLFILAVCVSSVDEGVKVVKQTKVYAVTALSSILAYIWLIIILAAWTPDVVTPTEGVLTFLFFPLILGLAYAADKDFWGMCGKTRVAPHDAAVADVAHLSKDQVVKLVRTNTSKMSDYTQDSAADMEAHVRRAAKALNPPTRATHRNNALSFLTGKKPTPKIDAELVDDVLGAGAAATSATPKVLDGVAGGKATLSFKEEAIEVFEADGKATLTVVRTGGMAEEVSCNYATADISATAGKDYVAAQGTLTFAPGETEKDIAITIIDDEKTRKELAACSINEAFEERRTAAQALRSVFAMKEMDEVPFFDFVSPRAVMEEYMDMICWRLSVKADGRKSGKNRWMKEKTSTCPSGESGMMRMITKGTSVTRSFRMRRRSFTSRARSV